MKMVGICDGCGSVLWFCEAGRESKGLDEIHRVNAFSFGDSLDRLCCVLGRGLVMCGAFPESEKLCVMLESALECWVTRARVMFGALLWRAPGGVRTVLSRSWDGITNKKIWRTEMTVSRNINRSR